jgi:hypothetical protein
MKVIHVIPMEVYERHKTNFQHHAHHLATGAVVSIGNINQHFQAALESEPGVLPLPFILSTESVGPEIAKHLAEHGVLESHKAFEAAAMVAKAHAGFAFSQF